MLAKIVLGNKENTMIKQQYVSFKLLVIVSLINRRQILSILMSLKT